MAPHRITAVVLAFLGVGAIAADRAGLALERRFDDTVHPFLETYCFACHGKEKQKGKLDLSLYSKMDLVAQDYRRWETVLEKLKAEEMPPEEAKRYPAAELRRSVIDWIQAMRKHEAQRNAGDPGVVRARRLSNAEYDYTIRDLTGVNIRPTREFPVDPANEAGFDNSGESLTMSPALLKKYLEAARRVAEHLVLKPDGFVFAPHPMVTEPDRDKYCVQRIVDFYQRQPTNYANYFLAAWRFKHRAALGQRKATLAEVAREEKLSAKYLAMIWSALSDKREEVGPLAVLQAMWRELPAPSGSTGHWPVPPGDSPGGTAATFSRRSTVALQKNARPLSVGASPVLPITGPDITRKGCERMSDFVIRLRQKLKPEFKNLALRGVSSGSQPLVLWKDRQYATNRMRYDHDALKLQSDLRPSSGADYSNRWKQESDPEFKFGTADFGFEVVRLIVSSGTNAPGSQVSEWDEKVSNATTNHAVVIFGDELMRPRFEAAFDRFCRVFPDALYVSERGRIFLQKDEGDRGRLLSAGFHLMVGYFRDDAPLYELILDERGRREIDALWRELDFITLAPMRQYKDFIFFERAEPPRFAQGAEFDFARSEDKDTTSDAKMRQMAETYLAKASRVTNAGPAIEAIKYYFKNISADIRSVEQARLAAEPSHVKALLSFAERAYRRPLSPAECDDLLAFYRSLRKEEGLDHEEAIRDTVASILVSPQFCYRVDLVAAGLRPAVKPGVPPGGKNIQNSKRAKMDDGPGGKMPPSTAGETPAATSVQALSDYALASRLSYFLWSSMPDEALLARAAAGDLHPRKVLIAQVQRMLDDERVRALATEFGANWLDFRRFEEHNTVDRGRFPAFNNELRQAMFEEPIRFFVDVVRENRSVLDFLYADYTFVNPVLAKHYGMPDIFPADEPQGRARSPLRAANAEEPSFPDRRRARSDASHLEPNDWARVENAHRYERGGLLPMSVFLTKNSPGLRTSPVKRGYWVVRRLLGETIPPPPATVPELPSDEAKLGDLTLREALARHREDKSCAGCHARFDSFGLVFEGYGPVGERRVNDLGGRPVDTHATFPGGGEGTGLDGLRRYLRERRQDEFLDNLCRKLLAYALGRSLLLSDDGLIQEMHAKLAANGYRFSSLVESIVTSPQFLNQRVQNDIAKKGTK